MPLLSGCTVTLYAVCCFSQPLAFSKTSLLYLGGVTCILSLICALVLAYLDRRAEKILHKEQGKTGTSSAWKESGTQGTFNDTLQWLRHDAALWCWMFIFPGSFLLVQISVCIPLFKRYDRVYILDFVLYISKMILVPMEGNNCNFWFFFFFSSYYLLSYLRDAVCGIF